FAKLAPGAPTKLLESLTTNRLISFLEKDAERQSILRETLDAAAAEVKKLPAGSAWGKLHVKAFRHSLKSQSKGTFDLPPIPRPGDADTVNSTEYAEGSFDQTGGASFREILDLSDWDHSLAINSPGQSGVPGTPHYADLADRWATGKYFPLLFSRA